VLKNAVLSVAVKLSSNGKAVLTIVFSGAALLDDAPLVALPLTELVEPAALETAADDATELATDDELLAGVNQSGNSESGLSLALSGEPPPQATMVQLNNSALNNFIFFIMITY
jgi:hypothetical protein